MEVNQKKGDFNIRQQALKVVGDEASYGVKVKG